METKFTPGPWEIGKCRDGCAGLYSDGHGHFAEVFYNSENEEGDDADFEDDAEAVATAALICAAPEMLALLERMAEWNVPSGFSDCDHAIVDARALLAKVKG